MDADIQVDLRDLYNIQHGEFNGYVETVEVESTSVVAQIVGKGGSKIKHLIQKYHCHIQSPSPNQAPVFIITGAKQFVLQIKQELLLAAEHFTSIARQRQDRISLITNDLEARTTKLHLPERYVGLIVGRFGRTVREMQKKFNVYIDTPKARNSSYFQIYGHESDIIAVLNDIHQSLMWKTKLKFIVRQDQDVWMEPADPNAVPAMDAFSNTSSNDVFAAMTAF